VAKRKKPLRGRGFDLLRANGGAELLLGRGDLLLLGLGDGVPAAAVHLAEQLLLHAVIVGKQLGHGLHDLGGGRLGEGGVVHRDQILFGVQAVVHLLLFTEVTVVVGAIHSFHLISNWYKVGRSGAGGAPPFACSNLRSRCRCIFGRRRSIWRSAPAPRSSGRKGRTTLFL